MTKGACEIYTTRRIPKIMRKEVIPTRNRKEGKEASMKNQHKDALTKSNTHVW